MTARYFAVRLLLVVPVALAASIIAFGIMRMLPGDVAVVILSGSGEATHSVEVREALREELGLNDSLAVQYGTWLWRMVNGDFGGRSLVDGQPIRSLVSHQLPVTALVVFYAMAISMALWIPLGILATWQRDRWPDHLVRVITVPGQAIPSFVIAVLVLLGLLLALGWSPPIVYTGPLDDPWNHLQIVVWPVALLAWEYGAHVVRVTRASMLEALHEEYTLVARAKGLPEHIILLRHVLRNAWPPIIATLGLQLGALLSTMLILESIFGLPGIGRGLVDAVLARDFPVVQSLVTLLVLGTLLVNLALDLTAARADPRIASVARTEQ